MRLFVRCKSCARHNTIEHAAHERSELPDTVHVVCTSSWCPTRGEPEAYSRREVFAEPGPGRIAGGAVVGGTVGGLIGGPLGAGLGGLAGGAASYRWLGHERDDASTFNASQPYKEPPFVPWGPTGAAPSGADEHARDAGTHHHSSA